MDKGTMEPTTLERLLERRAVAAAREHIRRSDARTLADMIELVQIPAPPFGEAERGAAVAERFAQVGLADVHTDEIGNVLGRLPVPAGAAAPIMVAAHLDTVFPAGTPIRVRQEGGKIHAPGIADNCRGLAAILALARALAETGVRPAAPLVFVATVGEEGVGDLRGVKHLFREDSPWRGIQAFVTLDGTGVRRIVNRGVGSRRFRVAIGGPGGHSWADWGTANPIHALGLVVAGLARIYPPRHPRTVLTVGRILGGTSVNSIPDSAWIELDLRSEAGTELRELEAQVRRIIAQGVAEADSLRRRGTPALTLTLELIGDRPTGETPSDARLVRLARQATRAIGEVPELVSSSTDANAAMALGIPAIAMGAGGDAGGTHTVDEWYANDKGPEGIERALLLLLGVAGVAGA